MEASSSSAPSFPCSYDVFLSFRGRETRTTFTDHLYAALTQAGIHTFRDDDEIERGEDIKKELDKAIQKSEVAVIVLSPDYASSRWCLDELVQINKRRKDGLIHILPIFYHIEPSEVKWRKRSYDMAFAKYEEEEEQLEMVQHWKDVLQEIAALSGEILKEDQYEASFIQKIVKLVLMKLDRKLLYEEPHLVGIDSYVNDINEWLEDDESTDKRILIVHGIGGVGKFEKCSFLQNVRETSKVLNFDWNYNEKTNKQLKLVTLSSHRPVKESITKVDFISAINPCKIELKLKVRVIRLCRIHQKDNPSQINGIELLLMDEQGDRIQVSINKNLVCDYEKRIKEMRTYYMNTFLFKSNENGIRYCNHKFKLGFTNDTNVRAAIDADISMNIFKFRPFIDLVNKEMVDENILFDAIGKVIWNAKPKQFNPSDKSIMLMELLLEDIEGNIVPATFWGDFVEQILPHLDSPNNHPVVVLQLVRARKYQDKYSIHNIWHASKLWIDPEIPEVELFKKRLVPGRDVADELTSGEIEILSIEEIIQRNEIGTFWILGKITDVLLDWGYSFPSCKKCKKKVDVISSWCEKCQINDSPIKRYNLKISVYNGSSFMNLLLWDKEAVHLVGKVANDIEKPTDLYCINNKRVLFKILVKIENTKKKNLPYTVKFLSTDPLIIEKYERPTIEEYNGS